MATRVQRSVIEVARRPDGTPWRISVVTVEGSEKGPSTGFVGGLYGDKPLGSLALHELVDRLVETDGLRGSVTIIPAANPPAFERGTRVSPDHLYLNRQFPGSPGGAITDQIAHHVYTTFVERVDCVVDVHSGTSTMGLHYGYDYGDIELSASFGYMPFVINFPIAGTLCAAVHADGLSTFAVEFGGGSRSSTAIGVEGCLNVLRYRGHLKGDPTGPAKVPLIDRVQLYTPSVAGVLGCAFGTEDVGRPVEAGVLAWVSNIQTGERFEEMTVEEPGLLMLANATPVMVEPGAFSCMVGFPCGEAKVHEGAAK